MIRVLATMLSALLCAPLPASAQPVEKVVKDGEKPPCDPSLPGYECFSKAELWQAGVRWRGKFQDAKLETSSVAASLRGCRKKLATRTSTAIRNLVIPPASSSETSGHSTTTVVIIGGLFLVAGVLIGAFAASNDQPQTIVVR